MQSWTPLVSVLAVTWVPKTSRPVTNWCTPFTLLLLDQRLALVSLTRQVRWGWCNTGVRRRSWWRCCNESRSSVVCGRHSIVCTQRTQVLTTAPRSHSGTRHSASDPADTRSSCPRPSTDRRSYTDPSYSPALQSYQPLATFSWLPRPVGRKWNGGL